MAIFRPPKSTIWHCEFVIRRVRIRRTTGTSDRREALAFEARLKAELAGRRDLGARPASLTLAQGLERHLAIRRTLSRAVGGIWREEDLAKDLIRAFGSEVRLEDIGVPLVNDFVERSLGRGHAPNSINRRLAMLRAMLRRAYRDWGALARMPTIRQVPLGPTRVRWLTEDEERHLLEAAPPFLRYLLTFLHDTGARLGEALRVTWVDVDLDRKPRPVVRFNQTKSGKPRTVPLPDRTAGMVRALSTERKPEPGARVFLNHYGNGYLDRPWGSWYATLKRSGVKDFRIHDFRHSYASRLAMRGVPLLVISQLLGHSSVKMTERYAHLCPSILDSYVGTLDASKRS